MKIDKEVCCEGGSVLPSCSLYYTMGGHR